MNTEDTKTLAALLEKWGLERVLEATGAFCDQKARQVAENDQNASAARAWAANAIRLETVLGWMRQNAAG
jgi:hypothetical protein